MEFYNPNIQQFFNSLFESNSMITNDLSTNRIDLPKLIKLLPQAICHLYNTDATKPSLVISYLPGDQYYVSVVRYRIKYAKDKYVAFNTQSGSLENALEQAAKWVIRQKEKENPVQQLEKLIDEEG